MSLRQSLARLVYATGKKSILTYMAELDRLQWLPLEQILARQNQQRLALLEYARNYVPYYQKLFKQIGFEPGDFAANPAVWQQIPPLTKQIIRQNYNDLITLEPARRATLQPVKTGGTTGEPLWFQQDDTYRYYNTAHNYHAMTWSGWQVGHPQAWLWGYQPDSLPTRGKLLFKLKEALINRYTTNAYVLTSASMNEFTALLEKRVKNGVLWSYVSTMYRFAQFLQQRGHHLKLQAVYTAGEPLFNSQRQFIQQILGCPVFNSYSSIDTGDIACECEHHQGLHIMARNCYVEIWDNGQVVSHDQEGEFVLTNLTNYGMPLIRYKLEDWGKKSQKTCPCGRNLPLLEVVEGRKIDLFKTKDGRTVFASFANKTIAALGGVKQFQVIQKSLNLIVFRLVQDNPIDPLKLRQLEEYTKATLGADVGVKFEFVDSLPTTPTGKHRFLISEVK
jgi:phenylacetate-CoA ligase